MILNAVEILSAKLVNLECFVTHSSLGIGFLTPFLIKYWCSLEDELLVRLRKLNVQESPDSNRDGMERKL